MPLFTCIHIWRNCVTSKACFFFFTTSSSLIKHFSTRRHSAHLAFLLSLHFYNSLLWVLFILFFFHFSKHYLHITFPSCQLDLTLINKNSQASLYMCVVCVCACACVVLALLFDNLFLVQFTEPPPPPPQEQEQFWAPQRFSLWRLFGWLLSGLTFRCSSC